MFLTCFLLILRVVQFKIIKEFKAPAKLGGGGLSNGVIGEVAYKTATAALELIMNQIKTNGGADIIVPYATSAVRDAKNGAEFAMHLSQKFGIKINIIPGEREAELIFKGIMRSLGFLLSPDKFFINNQNALMLDIGGGSNEFIITNGKEILWKKSFPIGMARMREKFNYVEPISKNVVNEFEEFCNSVLVELWDQVNIFKPTIFVGSSGSFDTFRDLIYGVKEFEEPQVRLLREDLDRLNCKLIGSTSKERMKMPGMHQIRVDYIVLASIFTQLVLNRVKPEVIYQSSYSLKEGAMFELFWKYLMGEELV
jgi:Exopolyphosphatase